MIETPRLLLREMTQEDFDGLKAVLSDPENMKFYPKPYDDAGVQRWLDWCKMNYQCFGFGLWAIIRKEDGAFIGDCGITMQRIDGWIRPEIGYHIRLSCHRQGYASEAAAAVRDWAFTNTPFRTLYSYMNSSHVASYSTAMKIGMTYRGEFDTEDGPHRYYAITRQAWANSQFPK